MEVVKDLTCPICLELYCHPVILPCSHVICKQPCADQLFDGNFIRCPVCRDNCYVSGGLLNLPRVITIESIIEKVRAERKKRNASNPGHARENSFDDMFSDVISESTANDMSTSPPVVVPICNSPGSSPVPFLRHDIPDSPSTITRHFPYTHLLLNSETTVSSSQINCQRNLTENVFEGTQAESLVSLRRSSPQRRDLVDLTENNTSLFNTNHSSIHNTQEMTRYSNDSTRDGLSLPPSTFSSFTTRLTPLIQTPIQTDHSFLLGDTPTPTSQDSESTPDLSPHRFPRQPSFITSTLSLDGATGQGQRGVGDSNYSFSTDQIQTSTPRADLRNIRLCHEQSLANLKACSDSIKALQKSRPSLRNTHNESLFSPRNDGANSCGSQRDDTLVSSANQNTIHFPLSANQNPVYLGEDKTTPLSSNQNSCDFGVNQSTIVASNIQDDTGESAPRLCELPNTSLAVQGTQDDEGQNATTVKLSIQTHLQRLCHIQNQLLYHMNSFTERAQTGQDLFDKGRSDINKECDSLVAEIETKRYQFLLHIDDERKRHSLEANDTTVAMQKLLASSQELSLFVEEILESKPQTILSTASALMDSLSSAVAECQSCLQTSEATHDDSDSDGYQHLIDTRLQRGVVERIEYLSVPQQPVFDVHRCSRNTSTVALVFQPPCLGDVIDHYEIIYCSHEQKTLGIEERYYAQMPDDPDVYGFHGDIFPMILIENLCQSTHYFFCACAVNKKGKSVPSDYVQCKTLADRECVVPVPSVIENQCQATSTSVTLTCPSLATVTSHQCVRHRLLQRSNSGAVVWKGAELTCKKEEFTVRRLRPGTHYNFVVIAYNGRGECQLSTNVALRTSGTPRPI